MFGNLISGLLGISRERTLNEYADNLTAARIDVAVSEDQIEMLLGQLDHERKLVDSTKALLENCMKTRLDIDHENAKLRESNRLISYKLDSATSAISIFAERYKISAAELRQLHVADMAVADPEKQGQDKAKPAFAPFLADDPLTALNAGNDFRQTAGKFRQLRQAFQSMQLALTQMFDGMEKDARKSPVTKDRIAEYRATAANLIGRKI